METRRSNVRPPHPPRALPARASCGQRPMLRPDCPNTGSSPAMTKGEQAVPEPAQRRPGRRRVAPARPSAKGIQAGPGPAQAEEQAARTPPSPPPSGCGLLRQLRNQHVGPASSPLAQPHPLSQSAGIPSAERSGRPGRRVPASAAARSGGLTGFRTRGTSPCHCGSGARAGESGGPLAPWAEKAGGHGSGATWPMDGCVTGGCQRGGGCAGRTLLLRVSIVVRCPVIRLGASPGRMRWSPACRTAPTNH